MVTEQWDDVDDGRSIACSQWSLGINHAAVVEVVCVEVVCPFE